MNDTSVPPVEFTPEGLVVPTDAEILAGVQADYNLAFGGNLSPALETPQGQLITSTSAAIADADAALHRAQSIDRHRRRHAVLIGPRASSS